MRTRATILSVFFMATACGGDDFQDTAPTPGTGGSGGQTEATGGAGGTGGGAGVGAEGGTAGAAGSDLDASVPDDVSPDTGLPDASEDVIPDAGPEVDPSCPAGWGNCDGDTTNGCETSLLESLEHCGGCGLACTSGPNGTGICVGGKCDLTCSTGYDDCDQNGSNGCEANLLGPDHCLGCGNACPSGANSEAVCTSAGCGLACDNGWDDCDTNASTGCEVDLATTPAHCGACNQACPSRPNATPACASSQCGFTCKAGYGDCDDVVSTGCEVDLTNTDEHCGACNAACAPPNGVAACANSQCSIYGCDMPFADCDGIYSNGCEQNVSDNIYHCGDCNRVCGSANGTPSCVNHTCRIACNTGYANCDDNHVNGCEKNLLTDPSNCGACGRSCGGGSCSGGFCTPLQVATGTGFTFNFAVSNSAIYFFGADNYLYKKIPGSTDKPVKFLSSPLISARDPWIDADKVYFAKSFSSGSILSLSLVHGSLGTTVEQESAGAYPRGVRFYGGKYWWIGGLWAESATPGTVGHEFANVGTDVDELRVDNTHVYWASPSGGAVRRALRTTGAEEDLASGQSQPRDIELVGQYLYWVNQGDGTVRLVPKAGGPIKTLATGQVSPGSVAASTTHVYWTTGDGGIWRVPLTGVGALKIAQGQSSPTDVTLHNGYVCWVTSDNKIMRVAW